MVLHNKVCSFREISRITGLSRVTAGGVQEYSLKCQPALPSAHGGKWWPEGLQIVKPSSGMLLPDGVAGDYCHQTSFSVPGKPLE